MLPIRIITLLLFTLFILVGCSERKTQQKKYDQTNSEVEITAAPAPESAEKAAVFTLPVPHADFEFIPNPEYTRWEGTRIAQAKWKDLRGNNVLIISKRPQFLWSITKPELKKYAASEDDSEAAEFYAVHYILGTDSVKWQKFWEYYEVKLSDMNVSFDYLPGTLTITDIDSNGLFESTYSYYTCIGTQALDYNYGGNLVMHIDSEAYKIKGTLGLMRNRDGQHTKIEFSSNYAKLGNPYKDHLAQLWQHNIALRDSMDKTLQNQWK